MWEFCVTVKKYREDVKKFIYKELEKYTAECGGVLTTFEDEKNYNILIACEMYEKNRLLLTLQNIIGECICFYFKREFLINSLQLCIGDNITKLAFVFALLFFDKETDKYIVNKYLVFDKKLNIESFYNFRLKQLKDKWCELIEIANENEVYLYSDETFLELIKFLIDNIEVKSDEINIMKNEDGYDAFDSKFAIIEDDENKKLSCEEKLVVKLIAKCPKNINIYCGERLPENLKDLICVLFEKRVKFISNINNC